MSSSFGTLFKITTFGESHGPALGVVLDGCPAGLQLDLEDIGHQLARRKPGQSRFTTPRKESDEFEILSGVYEGKTLGTPIAFVVHNKDALGGDYKRWSDVYRPSHADYTYHAKYGYRTPLGGGRASARETIGRVIAGAVAGQILKKEFGMEAIAWTESIGDIQAHLMENPPESRDTVDETPLRCPDESANRAMEQLVDGFKEKGDSVGGTVGVVVRNVPPGLGDPVFDKLEADLAKAALSIPACKGFESGSGFTGSPITGAAHNDLFEVVNPPFDRNPSDDDSPIWNPPNVMTKTNRSGGVQGGISNGMPITMRLAFKPTATIRMDQTTINEKGETVELKAGGRHDPCVVPRAIPIVESMVNLVLLDALFRQRAVHPSWFRRYSGHHS